MRVFGIRVVVVELMRWLRLGDFLKVVLLDVLIDRVLGRWRGKRGGRGFEEVRMAWEYLGRRN